MPEKKFRNPQEKKDLSYKKDRRNTYGENDKSSRKNIPRSKAQGNKKLRRVDKMDWVEEPDKAMDEFNKGKQVWWKKYADTPLGEVLDDKDV